MKKFLTLILLSVMTAAITVSAQTVGTPKFLLQQYADLAIASKVSDNGKWVIVKGATSEQKKSGVARILNTETKEVTVVKLANESDDDAVGKYIVNDITDDGNIIVGACNGTLTDDGSYLGGPAIFNMTTKKWTALPMPAQGKAGQAVAVTPDGKYAIGFYEDNAQNVMQSNSSGIMWNLETMTIMNLENLPTMPVDYSCKQEQYTDISADGKYIAIFGNQSINPTAFIYNTVDKTYIKFGKDGNNSPAGFIMMEGAAILSPNGKYAAATVRDNADNLFVTVLNLETMTYTSYNEVENLDNRAGHVDNYGNVYASSPSGTPVREWSVVSDGIWYPFSLIVKQRYGRSVYNITGFDNTGTLWAGSADGRVLGSMVSPQGESYVVCMPESINEACMGIDLLQDFTTTPTAGSSFHRMSTMTFLFTQNIKVQGGSTSAILKDSKGNKVRNSIGFALSQTDSHALVVTFRETALTEGETYTVEIPAGALSLAGNEAKTNQTITVSFTGRAEKPVSATKIYPENGAEVSVFDNTTTFPVITFDTKVATTKNAAARLIEITTDGEKTICSLAVVAKDNNIALMPATTQYLYSGASYKVVLDKGSVTDITGDVKSANEAITINYTGSYERQISTETAVLFSENFNNISAALANMMRYEGDHNTPTQEMQAWEFDADNQPWNLSIRDNENSTDICAASTSMYSPAGQSDDWIVTPQLIIPDEFCTLVFDAQKYQDLADDKLKVVIWECDENINTLTSDIISRMKADGEITTYDLSIGKTEEGLEGEWTRYAIDLAKYNGKKIYIGFWNNNRNESVIFLDNILVQRNLKYLMYLTNPQTVVNKTSQAIEGILFANSDIDTFSSVSLTLKDAAGNTIDAVSQDGLALKKNDYIGFQFTKPLPLTVGEVNDFTIDVKLDTYTDVVKSNVKDLTYEPVKRVVLEEMTGTTCPNCPLGILAIEYMEKLFGDRFIPISLHTYSGDPYSSSSLESYTQYLGLGAAPTGMIQRNGYICAPMSSESGSYQFSNDADLWLDFVSSEMDVPSYIGVSVPKATLDEETNKIKLQVEIQSALNMKGQYLNVFPVAMEDGLNNSQVNNFYTVSDANLGDWGKGGKYAQNMVYNIKHNDVVRTYWGTPAGTNVGFPQKMEAGQTYTQELELNYPEQIGDREKGKIAIMIIDGVTGGVVNAVVFPMKNITTGISNAIVDKAADIDIAVYGGSVAVMTGEPVTVSLYTTSGALIGTSTGNGSVAVSANGYHGTVIVKATTADKTVTKKVVM